MNTKDPTRHAVWDLYDELRTAYLNIKYYGARLHSIERQDFWIELVLAVTAPTAAISGWAVWSTGLGTLLWAALAGLAAVLSVAKPLLGYSEQIKNFQAVLTGYRTLFNDLQEIRLNVSQTGQYGVTEREGFKKARERKAELAQKDPENRANRDLIRLLQDEVTSEFPDQNFFVPQE